MTKSHSTTTNQLHSLIRQHVEKANATPPQPTIAASLYNSAEDRGRISLPKVDLSPATSRRYSLRLIASEMAKINAIINATGASIESRITFTDVLRVGLKRLGDSSSLTREELQWLRISDGRRHKTEE